MRFSLSLLGASLLLAVGIHAEEGEPVRRMVFSAVGPAVPVPQELTVPRPSGALAGAEPTITGADAKEFSIAPTADAGGGEAAGTKWKISFQPDGQKRLHEAVFELGALRVPLLAITTLAFEGENEATLAMVLHAVGAPVNTGYDALKSPTDGKLIGEEVADPRFVAAGSGPVSVRSVARYSPPWELPVGYYTGTGDGLKKQAFGALAASDSKCPDAHQRLLPPWSDGKPVQQFIPPPGEPFGLFCVSPKHTASTEAALNAGNKASVPNAVRVYPAREYLGYPLQDSFFVCFEEAKNGDYQDYVFLISNVAPAK